MPIEDKPTADISEHLDEICHFLGKSTISSIEITFFATNFNFTSSSLYSFSETNIKNLKQPCLVFSKLGISRAAAAIIAYFVYSERLDVKVKIKNRFIMQSSSFYSILKSAIIKFYFQKNFSKEAFDRVSKCKKIQPQTSFLEQIANKYSNNKN